MGFLRNLFGPPKLNIAQAAKVAVNIATMASESNCRPNELVREIDRFLGLVIDRSFPDYAVTPDDARAIARQAIYLFTDQKHLVDKQRDRNKAYWERPQLRRVTFAADADRTEYNRIAEKEHLERLEYDKGHEEHMVIVARLFGDFTHLLGHFPNAR